MTLIRIREHAEHELELDPAHAAALQGLDRRVIELRPSFRGPGWYAVQAKQRVGSVRWPDLDLTLSIVPKLPVQRLLFLLGYAERRSASREELGVLEARHDFLDAVARVFVDHAEAAIRRGLLHGYRQVEESSRVLRGRPDFTAQLRRRPGRCVPIEVRYDSFTSDTPENRSLRAAADRLLALGLGGLEIRQRLRALVGRLTAVASVRMNGKAVREIPLTRLNAHYERALGLAAWVLDGVSVEPGERGLVARSFLLDLAVVFEDFVLGALRTELGLGEAAMPRGETVRARRQLPLDEERTMHLQPDLSWWDGGACRVIGDMKYKDPAKHTGFEADLQQVLAYAVAAGLDEAWIVYGAAMQPLTHRIRGIAIHRVGLDLSLPPDELLGQIRELGAQLADSYESCVACDAVCV